MTLLTKANTFFFKEENKALALYLSQEQKSVSTDRNLFHLQTPYFSPPAFHPDQPHKMNLLTSSPEVRKIKACKLHKYVLPIIIAGIFFKTRQTIYSD